MGKRGPPKTPTTLQILRGNPGKRKIPQHEPMPKSDRIEPPEWMTGDALEKWKQLVPELLEVGLLTNVDVDALSRYCVTWQEWRKHLTMVQKGLDILVMRDESGNVKYTQVAPSATLVVKYASILARLEQQFGMTPSARAGLTMGEAQADNPFDAFMKKHG